VVNIKDFNLVLLGKWIWRLGSTMLPFGEKICRRFGSWRIRVVTSKTSLSGKLVMGSVSSSVRTGG